MSGRDGSDWTDERIAELTKLWSEGLSGGNISRQMGVSRCAIMGKVRRLNLVPHNDTPGWVRKRLTPHRSRSHAATPRAKPMPQPAPLELPPCAPVKLVDTQRQHCRFPMWSDEYGFALGFPVCGRDKADGSVYCSDHRRVTLGQQKKDVAA